MKKNTPFLLIGTLVLSTLTLSSCVTREDIRGIQTDLFSIQKRLESKLGTVEDQTNTVQTTQADLRLDMKELSDNIAALNAELQDSRTRVKDLATRLDDLEAALKARMDAQIELLSGSKFAEKPLPSTLYSLAETDFVRGRIPDSIKGFKKYIKTFPKGEQVPEAKLKIGDGYTKQKSYREAIATYNDLIKMFPEHRLVPTAMFRKGNAYEKSGKKSEAKTVYKKLINKYPYRSEARTAKDTLNQWKSKEFE